MQEKIKQSEQYILEAFDELLKKHLYDEISVCDVVEKAGVSRMSFYRNFKSKEDLAVRYVQNISNVLLGEIKQLNPRNNFTVTKLYFESMKMKKCQILSLIKSSSAKILANDISQKMKSNAPTDYLNKSSKYIPIYFHGAITNVLLAWLQNGDESPDEMAKLICSLQNFDVKDFS